VTILTILGLSALAIAGAFCVRQVARDFQEKQQLAAGTAFGVWSIYILFTGLVFWLSWSGAWAVPVNAPLAYSLGAGLILFGGALILSGMLEFRSFARMSGRRKDRLVKTGIYRWTRNPQNVGWGSVLLGTAIAGRSGAALALAAFFFTAFRLYIATEERHLERVYGDEWRDYSETTPRFFGPPQRKKQGQTIAASMN
jgi:protein-S-isoprenylcysteine O-methyltransferase Ste14